MQRKIINIDDVHIHYRELGNGPLLLLLHPSPRSGKMMEPLMNVLAANFTVIAPDTPGYGFSDSLPSKPNSLYDYIPYLHEFVRHLLRKNLSLDSDDTVMLYGTATGAQLAIAFALTHPSMVGHLFLDNVAHFEDAERNEILQNYFPDLQAKADGSHLQILWQHLCDSTQFFPWYAKTEATRIGSTMPPAQVLQAMAMEYQLAGDDYALAYRFAFEHERAEKVQALQVPSTIFKWLGSPILQHTERLLQHNLPSNVAVVQTPALLAERYNAMRTAMLATL
jgi:pimeloyl-ACP methyl ester carboxylesterase